MTSSFSFSVFIYTRTKKGGKMMNEKPVLSASKVMRVRNFKNKFLRDRVTKSKKGMVKQKTNKESKRDGLD
jgi:hypothetical protein